MATFKEQICLILAIIIFWCCFYASNLLYYVWEVIKIKVYDAKELAAELKVSYRSILKLLRSGELEGKKILGKWRVTENQLRQYLEGDSQGPTPREKNMSLDK